MAEFAPLRPVAIRSQLVLQIASELAGAGDRSIRLAEVRLGDLGTDQRPLQLSSMSTIAAMIDVADGKLDLAMANPSAALTLAFRGVGPFDHPLPLRTIAVIPAADQYVFAVRKEMGLTRFEDVAAQRAPLRVLVRGVADHFLHVMLDDIAAAAGFSVSDLATWGGGLRKEGQHPRPGDEKFAALARGEADAMFDEGAAGWVGAAADAGMTILPLGEETMRKLEALGYRRAVLRKALYPQLPGDVLTVDFSGWAIYVRADLPDERVTQICTALEARKAQIAWSEPGPLPLERMCNDAADAPLGVPLHAAAERFWRARGYLR